jgi:hypothetical protein
MRIIITESELKNIIKNELKEDYALTWDEVELN